MRQGLFKVIVGLPAVILGAYAYTAIPHILLFIKFNSHRNIFVL